MAMEITKPGTEPGFAILDENEAQLNNPRLLDHGLRRGASVLVRFAMYFGCMSALRGLFLRVPVLLAWTSLLFGAL